MFLQATSALYIIKLAPGSWDSERRCHGGRMTSKCASFISTNKNLAQIWRSPVTVMRPGAATRSNEHDQCFKHRHCDPRRGGCGGEGCEWTIPRCDCLFFYRLDSRADEAHRDADLEMEIMRVNLDKDGSVYADLSSHMCSLLVVRLWTSTQLVLDQISIICWSFRNPHTADECQDGASDATTGGIKSGCETCLSLEMLYWYSAFVHLCQFGNAHTDDSKAK